MNYKVGEWLSVPKDERLLLIKYTVAENVARQNKAKQMGA